jgi:hypothetical protein
MMLTNGWNEWLNNRFAFEYVQRGYIFTDQKGDFEVRLTQLYKPRKRHDLTDMYRLADLKWVPISLCTLPLLVICFYGYHDIEHDIDGGTICAVYGCSITKYRSTSTCYGQITRTVCHVVMLLPSL